MRLLQLPRLQELRQPRSQGLSSSHKREWSKNLSLLWEDERPWERGWIYVFPTPLCALAKIFPETTVRAYFYQIENASHSTSSIGDRSIPLRGDRTVKKQSHKMYQKAYFKLRLSILYLQELIRWSLFPEYHYK